ITYNLRVITRDRMCFKDKVVQQVMDNSKIVKDKLTNFVKNLVWKYSQHQINSF
ncbi:hypothetical protein L9F63_014408, partial [Diploptera punctata]